MADMLVRKTRACCSVLLPGQGKSTLATAVLEKLAEQQYQFCLIDPEGDYEQFEGAVTLAGPHRSPDLNEAVRALATPVTESDSQSGWSSVR